LPLDLIFLEFVIVDGERKRLQLIAISREGGGRAKREGVKVKTVKRCDVNSLMINC
jgi:hypothetical protein